MKLSPQAVLLASAVAVSTIVSPSPIRAQSYPIDCAILLCLAGGWPASVECTRARAVFIQRATPFPIEPPLQIWRCPMQAHYGHEINDSSFDTLIEVSLAASGPQPSAHDVGLTGARISSLRPETNEPVGLHEPVFAMPPIRGFPDASIQMVQAIDLAAPEFDFIRSIQMLHIVLRQHERDENSTLGRCYRRASVQLGSYDADAAFAWSTAAVADIPPLFTGPYVRYGDSRCSDVFVRSVYLQWSDAEGNLSFEQIDY